MIRYLLDTNTVSVAMRDRTGPVAQRLRAVPSGQVAISVVVLAELRFGAARRRSKRLSDLVEMTAGSLTVLPFSEPADAAYAQIRAELERLGTQIGANDLFIAAHAMALGCVLVTDNEREFRRVPGLAVENWLRDRD